MQNIETCTCIVQIRVKIKERKNVQSSVQKGNKNLVQFNRHGEDGLLKLTFV